MSSETKWEVVGGKAGSKQGKSNKASAKSDEAGKKSKSGAPTLKVEELVTPMDTKYALLDPEMRAQAKREALGIAQPAASNKLAKANNPSTKEAAKKKPSKDANKENKSVKNLPDGLKHLNMEELNQTMTVVKARFANSRLLWIKELTSYLNNNLNVETDPTFAGKPRDYPSTLLTGELKQLITSTIKEVGPEEAKVFYTQSLITMPTEINRGVHVNGTKIVLQLMSYQYPSLAKSFIAQANQLLPAIESRVPATLSLLWVLSQASLKEPRVGLQVWLDVMLPLAHLKNYSAFVAQAASLLTSKEIKAVPESLTVPEYFRLKEQVASMPPVVRQNAADLADALEAPMIAEHGGKMFGQFLRRLNSDQPGECRKLVDCLNADSAAFDTWRKDYKSNLMASAQLLDWISQNGPPKDRGVFQSLLLHFRTVNESFSPTKAPSEALKNCTRLCEILILDSNSGKKKSRSGGKLKTLNYLLLIALISLVWYDVRVHGQGHFDRSRLGGALKRHGVTDKAAELYQRAHPYLEQARPYLDKARDHALHLKDVIYKKGEELYPGMWAQLDLYCQAGWKVAKEQWAIAYDKASIYGAKGWELGSLYGNRFLDWSAVYRQQASVYAVQAIESGKVYYGKAAEVTSVYYAKTAEVASVYYQTAAKYTGELLKDDRVQNAWKYTQDMYHKALHAVGICTH